MRQLPGRKAGNNLQTSTLKFDETGEPPTSNNRSDSRLSCAWKEAVTSALRVSVSAVFPRCSMTAILPISDEALRKGHNRFP